MNSFHLAILQANDNGKISELGDLWRNYHPDAVLSDSDYQDLTDTNDLVITAVQD